MTKGSLSDNQAVAKPPNAWQCWARLKDGDKYRHCRNVAEFNQLTCRHHSSRETAAQTEHEALTEAELSSRRWLR